MERIAKVQLPPISVRVALLIFILWAAFLSFEFYGYGSDSYVRIHDNAEITLALKLTHQGAFTFWDRLQLGGTDTLTEVGTLDATNLLFAALPGWVAYGTLMFLQRFIAGYFTFRLLTDRFGVHPLFALISGMLYSQFSQNQINVQYQGFTTYDAFGLPGIPAILYVAGKLADRTDSRAKILLYSVLLGLAFASTSFFAYSIFFFPLIFVWLVFLEERRNAFIILSGFFLGWICLEFFELAASFNAAGLSQRTFRTYCPIDGNYLQLWNQQITQRFLQTINLVPFLVGASALFIHPRQPSYRRIWIVFSIGLACLFGGLLAIQFACSQANPFAILRGFNLSRFYLYFPFVCSVFAAIGLESLRQVNLRRTGLALPIVLSGVLVVSVLFTAYDVKQVTEAERRQGSNYHEIYENPYLEYLAGYIRSHDPTARAMVLDAAETPHAIFPGFLWPYGITTLDGYANLYSLRLKDYWLAMIDPLMKAFPTCRYGIRLRHEGETRLIFADGCVLQHELDFQHPDELVDFDLTDLAGARFIISPREVQSAGLTEIRVPELECGPLSSSCRRLFLYESTNALPFLSLRSSVRVFTDEQKLLNQLVQTDVTTLAQTAFLYQAEVADIPYNTVNDGPAEVRLESDEVDRLNLAVTTSTPKILVINQTFSPDWKAFVNGELAKIFPVYRVFTGLYIPPGEHEIELVYAPFYSPAYLAFWTRINLGWN